MIDPRRRQPRRFVVTGGGGFIGSHLVDALVSAGYDVVVLDDFSSGAEDNLAEALDHIELIRGSILDIEACQRAFDGADYVLHHAAVPSVSQSIDDPLASHRINATGTLNVLMAARTAGVRRVVYAGSCAAYGELPELPKHEQLATDPVSPYAATKLTGEAYCRAFYKSYGFETIALRYFNVFGPRQNPRGDYAAVIPRFISALARGEPPRVYGDGEQTRDFVYVKNVVQANLLACEAPVDACGEVFNIGCAKAVSLNELLELIQGLMGTEIKPEYEPARPGDVRFSVASIDRARRALRYEPTLSLEEGLRQTMASFVGRAGESRVV